MKKLIVCLIIFVLIVLQASSISEAANNITIGTSITYDKIPQSGARQIPHFPNHVDSANIVDNKLIIKYNDIEYNCNLAKNFQCYIEIADFSKLSGKHNNIPDIEYRKLSADELCYVWGNGLIDGIKPTNVHFIWFHKDNPGSESNTDINDPLKTQYLSQIFMSFSINK